MISTSLHAPPILRIRDLSVGYGTHSISRGITCDFGPNQFWVLIGKNGSGKSSFLKTVVGVIPPLAGILKWADSPKHLTGLGYVPQRAEINPTLPTTVEEFVSLGLVGSAIRRRERQAALEGALRSTALMEFSEKSYWTLSGGQRQRALLSRALIRHPTLLILDEPLHGLDMQAESSFMSALAEFMQGQGKTVIFVSHNPLPLRTLTTHVMYFHNNSVRVGTTDHFSNIQELVELSL